MNCDARDDEQAKPRGGGRAAWRAPVLVEYDIVANTEITNCGNGDDGVICQTAAS